MKQFKLLFALFAILFASQANAAVLTEDFEAPFPAWEAGWLGSNSNLQNIYGVGAGKGNNPDGLWIQDGLGLSNATEITFNAGFGSTINNFSIDVTSWITTLVFKVFDMSGNTILSTAVTSYYGAYTDPGSYQNISVFSANGVSKFGFYGSGIEGNTSIDNVKVNAGSVVPEPASLALLALGFVGIAATRRRKSA